MYASVGCEYRNIKRVDLLLFYKVTMIYIKKSPNQKSMQLNEKWVLAIVNHGMKIRVCICSLSVKLDFFKLTRLGVAVILNHFGLL